jgi:nematocidal protein AidA
MSTEPNVISSETTIVHVSLIIDAETLLSRYPQASQDPDAPTLVDEGFIFILDSPLLSDSKSTSRVLRISLGQATHLRCRTIALRAEHSAVIYGLEVDNAQVLPAPDLVINADQTVPSIDLENLTQPVAQQADDHFWRCQPLTQGKANGELRFMLVNSRCEAVGYFSWAVGILVE